MSKEKNITQVIQEVCEEICDKFCKYRDEQNEDCECGHYDDCPLNRLY